MTPIKESLYDRADRMLQSSDDAEDSNNDGFWIATGMRVVDHYQLTPCGDDDNLIMWLNIEWSVEDADEYNEDTRTFESAVLSSNNEQADEIITQEQAEYLLTYYFN